MASRRQHFLYEVRGDYIYTDLLEHYIVGKPEWIYTKRHYLCPLWFVSIDGDTDMYHAFTAETPTEAFRQALETAERIVAFEAEVRQKLEAGELPTDDNAEAETLCQPSLSDKQHYDALYDEMSHPEDLEFNELRECVKVKKSPKRDKYAEIYYHQIFAFTYYYRVVEAKYMKQPPERPEDVAFDFYVVVYPVFNTSQWITFGVTCDYCLPLLRFLNFLRTGRISDADTFGLKSQLRQKAEKYLETLKERRGDK